jgi:thymidine kinase
LCNQLYKQGKCKEIYLIKIENNTLIYSDERLENFLKSVIDSTYGNLPVSFINLNVEHPVTLNKSKELIEILKSKNIKSLAILTNAFHSRRTRMVYQKILEPENIRLYTLTYNTNFDKNNWWQQSDGFRMVVSEYLKYFYYRVKGYM